MGGGASARFFTLEVDQVWGAEHSDHAILDDSEEGCMTVIDWHVRQLEWWKKKLGISDYGVAWIAFAKGLVLGYALCFFI